MRTNRTRPLVELAGRIGSLAASRSRQLAASRGSSDHVRFEVVDAGSPLPFPAGSVDAILSNDAMCHIANRLDALRDRHRLLRPVEPSHRRPLA